MLERVQEQSWLRTLGESLSTRLHGAQRAIAQWAIVDDYDTVLDMHCRDGRLLRYLSQKFRLRACGIADDAQQARKLRGTAPNAEIFCARKEDIPWRDECFDAVFYQADKRQGGDDRGMLKEALRVLKPNGQLLIAVQGMPEAVCGLAEMAGIGDWEERIKPRDLIERMQAAGFEDVSYRTAQPFVGIAMGWKRSLAEE